MEPKLTPHLLLSLHGVSRGQAACDFWNDGTCLCQAGALAALLPVVLIATPSSHFLIATPSSHFYDSCSCVGDAGYGIVCVAAGSV